MALPQKETASETGYNDSSSSIAAPDLSIPTLSWWFQVHAREKVNATTTCSQQAA